MLGRFWNILSPVNTVDMCQNIESYDGLGTWIDSDYGSMLFASPD